MVPQALLSVLDAHEVLVSVEPIVSPESREDLAGVVLSFEEHEVFVYVDSEFDEVVAATSLPSELLRTGSRYDTGVWCDAAGCSMLWAWQMSNQQGYSDGLQIAFHRPGTGVPSVVVQVIGCASFLEVYEVRRAS